MKRKTTPPPWRVWSGLVIDEHNNIICSRDSFKRIDPESGEEMPIYAKDPHAIRPVEADNNTKLIAAAPELLKALKRLLKDWEDSIGHDPDYMGIANHARAAIEKAEGRSEQEDDDGRQWPAEDILKSVS